MNSSAVSPGRAGLLLLLTGQMLPLIDTSITNVALDSITHSLDASATQLELIVALYGVSFAVCPAMGSKLGDNYGRRRLFMWGRAFGLASLLCGMANSIGGLLAARTLQGAGAALIVPQILTTLHVTLKAAPMRARSVCMAGLAGLLLSSGRWAAAGWSRRISPAWAGATRSLSMSRSACWCWRLAAVMSRKPAAKPIRLSTGRAPSAWR